MMYPVNRNSWLDSAFKDLLDLDFTSRMNSTAPAVNVRENEQAYVMDIASPGLKKEFCKVNIDKDGNLVVKIESKAERKEGEKREHYLRREFSYTNYQQTYTLPDDVAKDRISAKVDNGILTVVMPKMKKEESKVARAIEIA